MSAITQLGYLGFEVSDLPAWQSFATDVLGLGIAERTETGLSLRMDGHKQRFFVEEGEADDLAVIGLQVTDERALGRLAEGLRQRGVAVEAGTESDRARRGVEAMVKLTDPGGHRLELFTGPEMADKPFSSAVLATEFVADDLGLGHAVVRARDLDASIHFWCELLGFRLSDRIVCDIGGYKVNIAFLHTNPRHHSIALGGGLPKRIHHFMLQVASMDDVGMAYDRAIDAGVRITQTLGRHPNDRMFSFYAQTPSGFEFEYGWGGLEVDDAVWEPKVYDRISEWGHRRPSRNVTV